MPRVKIHLTDEDCRLIGELLRMGHDWYEIAQRVRFWHDRVELEYRAWCRVNGERPRETVS